MTIVHKILRAIAITLAAAVVYLASSHLCERWLAAQHLFFVDGTLDELVAMPIAAVLALLVAAVAYTELARSRPFRALAGLFALGFAAAALWTAIVGDVGRWPAWILLTLPVLLGAWAAIRPRDTASMGPAARGVVITLVVGTAASAVYRPAAFAIEEYRPQRLPRVRIELVAASRSVQPVAGDAAPDSVLALDDERYDLQHQDHVVVEASDVRRVRWHDYGDMQFITVRIDGRSRERLLDRVQRRAGRHDAILVDGEPVAVTFYLLAPDRIVITREDKAELWRIYTRLTRPARAARRAALRAGPPAG